MKSRHVIVLCAVVALAFLAGGYFLGVREGVHVSEVVVAPLRGGLATRVLTDLKEGDTRGASLIFESQVTRGLLALNDLSESPMDRVAAFLSGFGPLTILDDSAVMLANYRKANPSPFSGEYLTHDPGETAEQRAFIDEAIERHREATEIVNRMVERYASK
jgi:hypothetical protein